jgi:hypothetical protein
MSHLMDEDDKSEDENGESNSKKNSHNLGTKMKNGKIKK